MVSRRNGGNHDYGGNNDYGLTGATRDPWASPAKPWPAGACDFIVGGVQQLKAFILNRKAALLFLSRRHLGSRE